MDDLLGEAMGNERESRVAAEWMPKNATCSQSGVALLMAAFVSLLILGIMLASSLNFESAETRSSSHKDRQRHVSQLADEGLTETLSWFRLQTDQPVLSFRKTGERHFTTLHMQYVWTSRGLVRSFPIMDQLWGRFEVYPDNYQDLRLRAKDLAPSADGNEPGQSWRIYARGCLYMHKDAAVAIDKAPNRILASVYRTAELRRFNLFLPALAAVCSANAAELFFGENVTIDAKGKGIGLAVARGTGKPSLGAAHVLGEPSLHVMEEYDTDDAKVLGAPLDVFKGFADRVVPAGEPFPEQLGEGSIVVVEGDRQIDGRKKVTGNGVLILLGEFTLRRGCEFEYSGLVYALQGFRIEGRIVLHGMLIGKKAIVIQGATEDQSSLLALDVRALDRVRKNLGRYHLSASQPADAVPARVLSRRKKP